MYNKTQTNQNMKLPKDNASLATSTWIYRHEMMNNFYEIPQLYGCSHSWFFDPEKFFTEVTQLVLCYYVEVNQNNPSFLPAKLACYTWVPTKHITLSLTSHIINVPLLSLAISPGLRLPQWSESLGVFGKKCFIFIFSNQVFIL